MMSIKLKRDTLLPNAWDYPFQKNSAYYRILSAIMAKLILNKFKIKMLGEIKISLYALSL